MAEEGQGVKFWLKNRARGGPRTRGRAQGGMTVGGPRNKGQLLFTVMTQTTDLNSNSSGLVEEGSRLVSSEVYFFNSPKHVS